MLFAAQQMGFRCWLQAVMRVEYWHERADAAHIPNFAEPFSVSLSRLFSRTLMLLAQAMH